jgi:hypothetical protein
MGIASVYAGKRMAPQVGLEPTTLRLTAGCSAIELLRSVVKARWNRATCNCHINNIIPGTRGKPRFSIIHTQALFIRPQAFSIAGHSSSLATALHRQRASFITGEHFHCGQAFGILRGWRAWE